MTQPNVRGFADPVAQAEITRLTAERDALRGLARALFAAARLWERCELTADQGHGRCRGAVAAVRWEVGFSDEVCEHHATTAEARGAIVVRLAVPSEPPVPSGGPVGDTSGRQP